MKMVDFKEIGYYFLCIIFVIVCCGFSGIFKIFNYDAVSLEIVTRIKSTGIEKYLASTNNQTSKKQANYYGKYRPNFIPENVLQGSETSGVWKHLFNSNKKVVFYVYDRNEKFHSDLSDYFSKNSYFDYYLFEPTTKNAFNGAMSGSVGPNKICNSIEECNKYRERAANYTLMTNFLANCGKGVCIFNPEKKQFVQIRHHNINEAKRMLDELKNW